MRLRTACGAGTALAPCMICAILNEPGGARLVLSSVMCIRVPRCGGGVRPVARASPNALYDPELAGFGESGGLFSQQASPGFIELWSLQSRMAYAIRNRGKGET